MVFCYSHWQDKYDELQRTVPTTEFHRGLPSAKMMTSLRNGIIILDDLMEQAVKDPNIMSIFTEGNHNKNISVIFLMQNMYQKGAHTRTMSMNTQYMVLFKNARDQTQIRTLAMQMFPADWRDFLKYYDEETSKPYEHVILDFHPSTQSSDRIVKAHHPPTDSTTADQPTTSAGIVGMDSRGLALLEQQFNIMNPYGAKLMKLKERMAALLKDPSIPHDEKVARHVELMDDFMLVKRKYQDNERGTPVPMIIDQPRKTQPVISPGAREEAALAPVPTSIPRLSLVNSYTLPDEQTPYHAIPETTAAQVRPKITPAVPSAGASFPTPPPSHQMPRPPGIPEYASNIPLPPSDDSDSDDDSDRDGRYMDDRPFSYSDTESEKKAKLRYGKMMKKLPPPAPPFIDDKDTDPRPLSYSDTESERQRKLNYVKKYPKRLKIKKPQYKF